MTISPEIQILVDRLNQELNQIEQQAREGLDIARRLLDRFPDNVRLIGLTATLANSLFFVDNFRTRIQTTLEQISATDTSPEAIQEAGEDLSEFLGRIFESKMLVSRTTAILEDLR